MAQLKFYVHQPKFKINYMDYNFIYIYILWKFNSQCPLYEDCSYHQVKTFNSYIHISYIHITILAKLGNIYKIHTQTHNFKTPIHLLTLSHKIDKYQKYSMKKLTPCFFRSFSPYRITLRQKAPNQLLLNKKPFSI